MNSVDDSFEYDEAPGRQADARSDYNTIVARRSQLMLDGRPSAFIGRMKPTSASHPRAANCLSATAIPARIFSAVIPGGTGQ